MIRILVKSHFFANEMSILAVDLDRINLDDDLIKKLEISLMIVSVLLKITFGHVQISVPKSVYRCRKQPVSTRES